MSVRTPGWPDVEIDGIERVNGLLLRLLDGLTDEQVGQPSRLPGWTRGHVLAHIAGVGNAIARQIENATFGREPVDLYDNGQVGRNAAIEVAAGDSAAEHVARVRAAVGRVAAALSRLTPEVLERPTGHRGRPVRALVAGWWREAGVHLTDVDLGDAPWDAALRAELARHLATRVPTGVQVHLVATDTDERWTLGDGAAITARGTANDLLAWLAGREALAVVFDAAGTPVAPPELGPWP